MTAGSCVAPPDAEAQGWVGIRRGVGCSPDGLHWVPPGEGTRRCGCGTVTQVPAGDRYCLPDGVCYCRACPHYVPAPPVNYRAAIAALYEKARQKNERKAGYRR